MHIWIPCALPHRYNNALDKANYASLALQNGNEGGDADDDEDGGTDDLSASLARARRAAQARSQVDSVTEEALSRRDAYLTGGVAATLGGPAGSHRYC